MRRKAYVVYHPIVAYWGGDLVARGVRSALRNNGFNSVLLTEFSAEMYDSLCPSDLIIAIGAPSTERLGNGRFDLSRLTIGLYNFVPMFGEGEYSAKAWQRFVWEQAKKHLRRKPSFILDFVPHSERYYKKLPDVDVPVAFAPVGYDEEYDMLRPSGRLEHDVVLLGRQREGEHRYNVLKELKKTVRVTPCPPELFIRKNREKDRLPWIKPLLKTKIWLHANREQGMRNFPDVRIVIYGLSCRLCVVTEPTDWAPPMVSGEHWVVCQTSDLAATCKRLLSSEKEFPRIGSSGYEFVRNYWRYDTHLHEALRALGQL